MSNRILFLILNTMLYWTYSRRKGNTIHILTFKANEGGYADIAVLIGYCALSPFRYFLFHLIIFSHQVITAILAAMTSATHTAASQHALLKTLKTSLDKVLDNLPRILVLLSSHHQKIFLTI